MVDFDLILILLPLNKLQLLNLIIQKMEKHETMIKRSLSCKSTESPSLNDSLIEEDQPTLPSNSDKSPKKDYIPPFKFQQQSNNKSETPTTASKQAKKEKKKFSWPVWRKLFQYSLKRKWHLLIAMVLNLLFGVLVSQLPLKIGNILDIVTQSKTDSSAKSIDDLKFSVMWLGIFVVVIALLAFVRYWSIQLLQQYLAMDIRNDFFKKFIQNDVFFFETYKSGELVSRLKSDVAQAKSAVSNNLTFLMRNILIVVSNIVILFAINTQLAQCIMLLVPIYALITYQYSKRSKILVKDYQDVQAQMSANITQKFQGVQLVKAYSTQSDQIQRYSDIIMQGFLINKKQIFITGMYNSCTQFLPYFGIIAVLLYGGIMVIDQSSELTAGQLTSFILYCTSLVNATSAISNSYANIINGTYAVQKIFKMLQYKPLLDQYNGEENVISGQVQFNNVVFKYPNSQNLTLKGVSFEIKSGDYVAFVGESGSGKSTIVKLIQKFYQIQSGSIRFGPHDQQVMKATFLRRQIGLVNQQATIFSGTIQDNITYGLQDFSLEEMEEAAQRAGCLQFINDKRRFPKRFLTEVSEKGGNLSGGQKQRIAIARALMRKPKIIIFDEATSALDSNSQRMVQTSIENLAKAENTNRPTIIVIAHRLSTILKTDRIFVMKSGKVIQSGSHHQLKELRGFYYKLVEKQLQDQPLKLNPCLQQISQ